MYLLVYIYLQGQGFYSEWCYSLTLFKNSREDVVEEAGWIRFIYEEHLIIA